MKCLVTGASGLIGSELCQQLVQQGHQVWAMDNGFRGQAKPLCHHWLDHDLALAWPDIVCDFDQIYHMAAINGTKYFYDIPNQLLSNNVRCDLNLFEWASTSDRLEALIYGSSSEVISGTGQTPTPEELDVCVLDLHNPRWSYRLAKMAAENYLANSDLPWLGIRFFNVYGTQSKAGHFVYDQMCNISQGIFRLIGAEETRTFCFVSDAVQAVVQLADLGCRNLINVGSDLEIKILEAANTIARHMGHHKCDWELTPGRAGSAATRKPDISRLRRALPDYQPRSFDQGMALVIKAWNHAR